VGLWNDGLAAAMFNWGNSVLILRRHGGWPGEAKFWKFVMEGLLGKT